MRPELSLLLVALAAMSFSCGEDDAVRDADCVSPSAASSSSGSDGRGVYGDYAVVVPSGCREQLEDVAILDLRTDRDGSAYALVEGGICSALAAVDVTESDTEVVIKAAASTTDEVCPLRVVPWLTALDLDTPLGSRVVIDGNSGKAVHVVDCRTDGGHSLCSY